MKLAVVHQAYDPIRGVREDVRATFQQKFDEMLNQIGGVVVISPRRHAWRC